MRIWIKALKSWAIKSAYLGFAVCVVLAGSGCASTQKTTTTTTTMTMERPGSAVVGTGGQQDSVAQQSESTTATTETDAGHPGLLSSTIHAIGWVIALPFRLVGGLIRWIF
jgi:hypothetical protein